MEDSHLMGEWKSGSPEANLSPGPLLFLKGIHPGMGCSGEPESYALSSMSCFSFLVNVLKEYRSTGDLCVCSISQ